MIIRRAIDDALEALSVLMAIRKAPPDAAQSQGVFYSSSTLLVANYVHTDKRNKRNRGPSPLTSGTPPPVNKITLNVKADRSSESPAAQPPPYKADPKARYKFYQRQLPLHEGRKVAFHPPSTGGAETDENTWILAVITRCFANEKHR